LKHLPTILRWSFILLVVLAFKCAGQCCEDFTLVRNDTTLGKGIFVIEPKPGKQARIVFEDIPAVTSFIDNMSSQITYTGLWSNGATTASGFQQNTIAWSNTIGNTLTLAFSGTKLEWFSEYKTTHGRASVTVNSIERIINLGSANSGPGIVAEWNLPQGNYTIIIKVLDAKPVVHDGWRVTH
jgi:hypothetical protein